MIRPSLVMVGIIIGIALTDVLLAWTLHLQISSAYFLVPLAFVLILMCINAYCRRLPEPRFMSCLAALLCLMAFASVYLVLMRAVTTFDRPLIDDLLLEVDRFFGVHIPSVIAWAERHPMDRALNYAYGTLILQMLFMLIFLGFRNERRSLWSFVLRFALSLLPTTAVHAFYPAEGPFTSYQYAPSASQKRYMHEFHSLREGRSTDLGQGNAGLITFPSFHTAWALLLTLALRRHRLLFAAAVVLNGMVIVATMTSGWHYLSDVLAGVAVCVLTVALTRSLDGWLFAPPAQPGTAP